MLLRTILALHAVLPFIAIGSTYRDLEHKLLAIIVRLERVQDGRKQEA